MQTSQVKLGLPTRNDAILAETLGKIHRIVLKPNTGTAAQKILDKAILDHLMLYLLAAPSELLHSC